MCRLASHQPALATISRAVHFDAEPPVHVDMAATHGDGGRDHAREHAALALYADGRTEWLVALGGRIDCCDPDRTFANAAHRRLLGLGAPTDATIRIDEGGSTFGELWALRRAAEVHGWRSIALATNGWHTRRAAMEAARVFRGSDVSWTVVSLDAENALAEWWRTPHMRRIVVAEWAKIVALAFTPSWA